MPRPSCHLGPRRVSPTTHPSLKNMTLWAPWGKRGQRGLKGTAGQPLAGCCPPRA